MPFQEEVIEYMNLIARACAVVSSYPKELNNLYVMRGFNKSFDEDWKNVARAWLTKSSICGFIVYVKSILDDIEKPVENARYITALAICLWLEENITYDDRSTLDAKAFFSVSQLIQFNGTNKVVFIDAMNTNYEETGVQIIPKFEICKHSAEELKMADSNRPNAYANRDAFAGLNGKTKKISFVKYDENFHIHNIILPFRFLRHTEEVLNIAFCPLTDRDLIITKNVKKKEQNAVYETDKVIGIKQPGQLLKRLQNDWRHACNVGNADIIFYPEALGTDLSEETLNDGHYNKHIFAMAKEESGKANKLPMLTVLPSFCKDGENKATLLDKNGFIIAKQHKYEPYFNLKHNCKEYLKEYKKKEYYVIHVPKLHRIAVLICADFLYYNKNDAIKLFTEVGCTLLLVPSYSHREMDFVNTIQTLRPYGTTVIWGNSCGAVDTQQIIGGCCVAGFDKVTKFNDYCDCVEGCVGVEKCAFIVSVPLRLPGSDVAMVTDITVKRI